MKAAATVLITALTLTGLAHAMPPDAQGTWAEQKCGRCHSLTAAGLEAKPTGKNKGGDLSDMAKRGFSQDAVVRFLRKETVLREKKHPRRFDGSRYEVERLVKWLFAPTRK